jgi:hypothetical protein
MTSTGLDVSGLSPGAYILEVLAPNGTVKRTFIKE